MLEFTIIIPTLNEEKALPILLNNLKKQTYQHFKIIIVDGTSDDRTAAKVESFKQLNPGLSIDFYQVAKRNVSYQRNYGARKATTNWLIFMDADNQLPAYFLLGIAYRLALNHNKVDVFSTLIHLNDQDEDDNRNLAIAKAINLYLVSANNTSQPVSFGAMIGARKQVTDKLQFGENSKVMEDGIFIKKAKKLGFHFMLFEDPTFAYSLRRIRSKGLMRTARSTVLMQLGYLFGAEFKKTDVGYEMLGGGDYDEHKKIASHHTI